MKKYLSIVVASLLLTGCSMTRAPFMPSTGMIYSDTKAPLSLEYHNMDLGHKIGTSTAHSFMGLFAFGDTSIQGAAKDGNIKIIKHTDYSFTSVFFGLFTKTTVYVYGD